jgi:hypothetical protein
MVVASGFSGNFHRTQRGEIFVGEFGNVHSSPIQAPQSLIFLGREQHDIVTAVTGHYDRFTMRSAP